MKRRAAVRTVALSFLIAAVLGAGSARALVIEGRVVKGADRAPVANQRVTLHVVRGSEEVPGATKSTGADGRVRFENIPGGNGLEFYMATEYEGAFYTEGPMQPGPDGSYRQEMTVFAVGKEIDKIEVSNHHVIVQRKDDGLHVNEILVVQNAADTAYLGIGANHAENSGIRLGLPASIKGFEPGMGGEEGTLVAQGRELMSLRPIPPGQRPLSFSYHVPLSGRMDLSHRFYFPTGTFVVMIDDPRLKLDSKALTYSGSREQGGKKYEMYTASNLATGTEVKIRVLGASLWSNPAIYPWLAVPFIVVGVLVFARRMSSRAPHALPPAGPAFRPPTLAVSAAAGAPKPARVVAPPSGASRNGDDLAQTYAYLIAALDHGLDKGEVSAESHSLLRGNLKRRLELILSDEPAPRGH